MKTLFYCMRHARKLDAFDMKSELNKKIVSLPTWQYRILNKWVMLTYWVQEKKLDAKLWFYDPYINPIKAVLFILLLTLCKLLIF